MYINFSDIPGHQNLFLDYLYEFENVTDFYAYDFRNRENFLKIFKNITESRRILSPDIGSLISGQYSNFAPSELT